MSTIFQLRDTTLTGAGLHQSPDTDAVDLDGYSELATFVTADNTTGGSTLDIMVVHGAVARQSQMLELFSLEVLPGTSLTTMFYRTQFGRFTLAAGDFANPANANNRADVEIVHVPKKR